jgi:tRNA(fMet)-specific endonuclease VapC
LEVRIALDSNRYSDLRRIVPEVVEFLKGVEEIHVPIIVLGELRAGFAGGTRRGENERALSVFLRQEGVYVVVPDQQTTHVYADMRAFLKELGLPIPTNDLWIAALAVQHNLVLFDRDSHFDRLPQVARVGQLGL